MNNYKERYISIASSLESKRKKLNELEKKFKQKNEESRKLNYKYQEEYKNYLNLNYNLEKIVTKHDGVINVICNSIWLLISIGVVYVSSNIIKSMTYNSILNYILSGGILIISGSLCFSLLLIVSPIKYKLTNYFRNKKIKNDSKCQSIVKKMNTKEKEYTVTKENQKVVESEISITEEEIETIKNEIKIDMDNLRELEKEIITNIISPIKTIDKEEYIEEPRPYTRKKQIKKEI